MRLIQTAQLWVLKTTLFLLPLFFLPATADAFDLPKLSLLVVGMLASLILWFAGKIGHEFKFSASRLDLPVVLFAAVLLVSTFLQTPNKLDAFVFPGTTTLVLAATLLYFLVVQLRSTSEESKPTSEVLVWFLAGGAVAALISFLSAIGLFVLLGRFAPLPLWLNNQAFQTTGGVLPSLTLYAVLLPLAVTGLLRSKETKIKILNFDLGKFPYSISYLLFTILLVLGLGAALFQALPGKPTSPRILPLSTGWSISLEVFKKSPLFGVGPGNFVEAFSRFRPVEYNQTDVWNLRFGTSSNWPLDVFTVSGILGLLALAFLAWRLYKLRPTTHYSLLATIVLLFLVPANLLLLVAFYLLLALVAAQHSREVSVVLGVGEGAGRRANILPAALLLTTATLTVVLLYFGGRVFAAELAYKRALDAASQNDGTGTYNALIRTINLNPGRDTYRITYSQVNLALANAIAGKGDQITDQDRQTISQLVQQAIREAKAAVALHQRKAGNWENLARIYQALIPFAQGADQWTTAAYQQAIALDPVNPGLRIAFGGVFYSLGRYDDAIKVFELAVAAKPDFANAHYNLAAALREKGDTQGAISEMERVLQLVASGTQDYQIAQSDLETLRGKLAEEKEATASGETLEVAETPTEPALEPPLEIEGAEPPATEEAKPIPAPRVSPSPSPRP